MIPVRKLVPINEVKQRKITTFKIPVIKLSGEWLAKAGFHPNDSAEIAIYKNTLIIRPVTNDNE
jgi:hypothetical protein